MTDEPNRGCCLVMPFSNAQNAAVSFLVLRHLYDGDVIEWPLDQGHPLRALFTLLETQGYVARWDRMWPLADRYRLSEKGIKLIESAYRPKDAEALFQQIKARNLVPEQRRAFLGSMQLDPWVWPLLHDPYTHWSTWIEVHGAWHDYIWEDLLPHYKAKLAQQQAAQKAKGADPKNPFAQQGKNPFAAQNPFAEGDPLAQGQAQQPGQARRAVPYAKPGQPGARPVRQPGSRHSGSSDSDDYDYDDSSYVNIHHHHHHHHHDGPGHDVIDLDSGGEGSGYDPGTGGDVS